MQAASLPVVADQQFVYLDGYWSVNIELKFSLAQSL
jgi:hypothetical protein